MLIRCGRDECTNPSRRKRSVSFRIEKLSDQLAAPMMRVGPRCAPFHSYGAWTLGLSGLSNQRRIKSRIHQMPSESRSFIALVKLLRHGHMAITKPCGITLVSPV
jgi:hypothetical protein